MEYVWTWIKEKNLFNKKILPYTYTGMDKLILFTTEKYLSILETYLIL